MISFNLTDNQWIPVIMLDKTLKKVSLIELFENAHLIQEIQCESILETISVNRFLQALLIRIYQINQENTWYEIWNQQKFDISPAKNYFQKWYKRFDIFDNDRPFYQTTHSLSNSPTPITKLKHENSSANNATLFDHNYDQKEYYIPISSLPILLITAQAYSVGGGVSHPFNFSGAPLIDGCSFWINENNLFTSLLINTPHNCIDIKPDSKCSWEKDYPVQCVSRVPENYLDYLTWQSRSIKFEYNEENSFDQNGNIIFSNEKAKMYFHQGDKLESSFEDPLMAKRQNKDKIFSLRFDLKKSLWRNAEILFNINKQNQGSRTAKNIDFINDNYYEKLDFNEFHKFKIEAFGLINDQAKIVTFKKETLPFFPIISKQNKDYSISQFINICETQAKILSSALFILGKNILYHSDEEKDEKTNLSKEEKNNIYSFIDNLSTLNNYWADLELLFTTFLENLATEQINSTEEMQEFMKHYAKQIYDTARNSFDKTTRNFTTNTKHFKAIILAEIKLYPVKINGGQNDSTKE